MTRSPSPEDVARRLIAGITARRFDDVWPLYAEDVVVELPYAIPAPQRFDGRAAMRAHFADAGDLPLRLRADNIVVHATTDPERIVVEYDYAGEVTTTGKTFVSRNIIVLRVRDGAIVESRDYHDHRAFAEALTP